MKNVIFVKAYVHCFDLLYQDKDYSKDVDFTVQLLQTFAPSAKSILDLGYGTGAHVYLFVEQGLEVYRIDSSAEMILQANQRRVKGSPKLANQLVFEHEDLRSLQLNRSYDAVIFIFHVMSYQILIKDKRQETLEEFTKSHPMRYLCKPEMDLMLIICQILIDCCERISQRKLGFETWSAYCIAKV